MCARELITDFVNEIPDLYGTTMVKFNFHCLLHLPDEVLYFRENLDTFGAFKFENHLYKVKKMVRKGNNVANQIYNRLVERSLLINNADRKEVAVSNVEIFWSEQFPDNYYIVENKIFKIQSLVKQEGKKICYSNEVINLKYFF